MIEMILLFSIYVLPTITVFSLLKAIKNIVEKNETVSWIIFAVIASICLTITCIAVAYFK